MTAEQIHDVMQIAERWHHAARLNATPGTGQACFDIGYLVGLLVMVDPELANEINGGSNGTRREKRSQL